MFIYNVHAPSKTFALAAKDADNCSTLIDRIIEKARLSTKDADAIRSRKDGAGIVYEFEGDRWALEDDDDLAIVTARFRTEAETNHSPSITLHVVQPHAQSQHQHFNHSHASHHRANGSAPPPTYTSASAQLQARTEEKNRERKLLRSATPRAPSVAGSAAGAHLRVPQDRLTASTSVCVPNAVKNQARSVTGRSVKTGLSTRSRRSKWGDDDAEPMGEVLRRNFNEFHSNNGVRTVVGNVGGVENVRMLLKSGYRHVYLSRAFATRHGLISPKQTPGMGGYGGLKVLGNVSITVGSHTGVHSAMLSEEQHFDVVLGRSWIEKMNIKVDPMDPTALTYMDNGETIPCDLVVLRDAKGEVITIT